MPILENFFGVNPNKQTIQHKKTKHKTTTGNQTSASFKWTLQDKILDAKCKRNIYLAAKQQTVG